MKIDPIILYGLHFSPGIAEYRPRGKDMYRVLIRGETAKQMDVTFPGRPVYVNHVDEIDLEKADGYVVDSFYNKADGHHWCKFVITTKQAQLAVQRGYTLSNAYQPTGTGPGGTWQGVDYKSEINAANYDHMALVQDPRYTQSIIFTPAEFKNYNAALEAELLKLANAADETITNDNENKEENDSMLNFFKKEKVTNSADLENTVVELPKTKRQLTIAELVKNADYCEKDVYANGDHKVKAGEEEMSVNEMIGKYQNMKKNAEDAEEEKKKNEAMSEEEKKKNAEDEEKKKKENAEKEEAELKNKKKNEADAAKKAEFEKLKNARETGAGPTVTIMTPREQVALGNSRYGSGS